jgi:hypothetical protein
VLHDMFGIPVEEIPPIVDRSGDFDALVAVLDPDVVLRGDGGPDVPPGSWLEPDFVSDPEVMARIDLTILDPS